MMTTISGLYLLRITDNLNEFSLLPYKDKKAEGLFRNWSRICHCEGNVVKQSDRFIQQLLETLACSEGVYFSTKEHGLNKMQNFILFLASLSFI
ncbi:hypothetical protein [Nostoc sp.]|uniref:hypothetical protein n=1 Tax=Nostoc sp. TaxID=1180 RepID=UPI002FF655A1